MADHAAWAVAYARQARADFETYETLLDLSVPDCHRLQFLQMACEKLSKSHLCANKGNLADLQKSHAYIAGTLPVVVRQQVLWVRLGAGPARIANKFVRHFAPEIELVSPTVTRNGARPDNCEYPWEDENSQLHVPLDWSFTPSQLLLMPSARTVLKLIKGAINRLVS